MKTEHWRKFIESLEGEKGLPDEMLELRFDAKLSDAWDSKLDSYELSCYFAERARRAESRQIPDLKEKVKELVLDAMDAQAAYDPDPVYDVKTGKQVVGYSEAEQFRALCEPEKDSKEAP